jgi:hypothetical protein
MKSASYTTTHVTPIAVFIVDNDVGVSVTNAAEAVVAAIAAEYPERRIFYKDTMGEWGELVHNRGAFLRFAGIAPVTHKRYELYFS